MIDSLRSLLYATFFEVESPNIVNRMFERLSDELTKDDEPSDKQRSRDVTTKFAKPSINAVEMGTWSAARTSL